MTCELPGLQHIAKKQETTWIIIIIKKKKFTQISIKPSFELREYDSFDSKHEAFTL